MQKILQTGLSAGLSATSGFHSSKPPSMPKNYDHSRELLPADFIPKPDSRVSYPCKTGKAPSASLISIGAWPWGDTATWHYKPEELDAIKAAWRECMNNGVNFIDTAQVYGSGESERICGELFREMLANGKTRDDFVIQTKYWVLPVDPKNMLKPNTAPQKMLKESLERMKLDYVDIYVVHGHIHPQTIAQTAKSMAQCVEEGLTKCVGIANYNKEDMLEFKEELSKYGIPLATNQCEYSVLRREPEISGLLKACKDNNIIFQSYSSLAQGRLSGKYSVENGKEPPKTYRFSSYPIKEIQPTLDVLTKIAATRNTSVASVALNYNLVHGISPVCGVRNPQQARDNCSALGWRLLDEEIAEIDAVSFEGKTTKLWQQG